MLPEVTSILDFYYEHCVFYFIYFLFSKAHSYEQVLEAKRSGGHTIPLYILQLHTIPARGVKSIYFRAPVATKSQADSRTPAAASCGKMSSPLKKHKGRHSIAPSLTSPAALISLPSTPHLIQTLHSAQSH